VGCKLKAPFYHLQFLPFYILPFSRTILPVVFPSEGFFSNFPKIMQQNFRSGLLLQYLPNLMHLAICDADLELIQCLALFCPRLSVLSLENSDINDDIVAHLCSLKRLRSLSLGDGPGLSPFGFAELLRSLPDLRNIGRLLWRYFLL
jgi:hypothetical protein